MGWFTKDQELKFEQSGTSRASEKVLKGMMERDINTPQRQIANISPLTQQAISNYAKSVPQIQEYYQQAAGVYSGMAQGANPYTSEYYQNLRSQADRTSNRVATQVRQQSNMGGALGSTPAQVAEANARISVESGLMSVLGDMYQQDIQNRYAGAQGLQQVGQGMANQATQQAQLGSIFQKRQQAVYDAIYEQTLNQTLAPYQYKTAIAQSLYNPIVTTRGGGLNDLGMALQMASQAATRAGQASKSGNIWATIGAGIAGAAEGRMKGEQYNQQIQYNNSSSTTSADQGQF